MALESKRAICQFCHPRCRIKVTSENGRLVQVEEDDTFARAGTTFPPVQACLRVRGSREFMSHPDRVNFPKKRAGEKGEGKWTTISWEQAFDEIAEKLTALTRQYGPETLAITTGTGRTTYEFPGRFCNLLGTPNILGQSHICFGPCVVAGSAMFGWSVRHRTVKAIDTGSGKESVTKCALLIGIDPSQSTPRLWKSARAGKAMGLKLIVVDPRRTQTAEMADLWLQLRPGTDTALLMAMTNVIVREKLYDKDFVDKWCYGFDSLIERVSPCTPEWAAAITQVPADKIIEAARMYATSKPAFSIHGMGTEHLQDCMEAIQARFILTAITGNLDVEGGDYLSGPSGMVPSEEVSLDRLLSVAQREKQLGADRFRLLSWPGRELIQENVKRLWGHESGMATLNALAQAPAVYRAMLTGKPYPVRAAFTVASNPMLTQANVKLVYRALKSLDLYVVADYWLTPSAELADYVLPVASWLERPYISDVGGTDSDIYAGEQALPAAISGEYDHKTDYEIFRGIGIRMGQEKYWPWETLEQAFDFRLKPLGMTHREFMARGGFHSPPPRFRKYQTMGFSTPTGKVELQSTIFEKLGYDPLPRYREDFESPVSRPDLAKEYPLMLMTGSRFHPMYHSEHRNIDSVRRRHPNPLLQINPATATGLGIADGDWVWVETLRGRIRMKSCHFEGVAPNVVHAEHGWWFPELPAEEPWLHGVWESNVNILTADDPEACNELSGGWPLKTALCKVYKVKEFKQTVASSE
ncbi:MAG: molybdopterin-dependent oxidoreductase [Chloroflexi bacterium]|nr:molybdopterin-dependent oxidoreductase [Chloroflexota bacterium]